jgi:serine phosphatase RsbU (regulator of sigma subunit)
MRPDVVDHAAVFDALPTPYLVVTPELQIVGVNRAYLQATGRRAADLLGLPLFDAFPDDPDDPTARATDRLRQSLVRALRTGRPDTMPVQRYNIPSAEGFERRWWSPVNVPVLDRDGRVSLLVHRVEDVTPVIADLIERDEVSDPDAVTLPAQAPPLVDLYLRGHELRDALTEESVAALRLNGLVEVARRLNTAETLDDLLDVVVSRGLQVLGAEGGLVAEIDGDVLATTATAAVDPHRRRRHDRAPLTGRLPSSVAAATRSRVLLPTRDTSLAWSAEMPDIVESTGLVAWASLPLEVGAKVLGSLTVGWRVAQHFDERDVQLLDAFAALLAQALHRIRRAEHDRERLAAERALMTELQLSLLTEPVQPEGLEVAVRYRPSAQHARIGGDWYDAFRSGPDHLDVVIGDVTGHDREAAATMAQLRTLVRGVSATLRSSPGAVLEAVEQAMSRLELDTFATAVVAQVRLEADADGSRRVRWSSAGHLPPVVLHPDGGVEPLRAPPQLLLGLSPTTRRRDHEVALRPGASLVLYTDGLVESRASSARDGIERLLQTLDDRPGLSAQEVCDLLLEAQERQEDDVALLVLRALP